MPSIYLFCAGFFSVAPIMTGYVRAKPLVCLQAASSACANGFSGAVSIDSAELEHRDIYEKKKRLQKFQKDYKNQCVDSNLRICTFGQIMPETGSSAALVVLQDPEHVQPEEEETQCIAKSRKLGPLQGPSFFLHRRLSRLRQMGFRYPKFSVRSNDIHRGFATGLKKYGLKQ